MTHSPETHQSAPSADEWVRIQALFHELADRPAAEQVASLGRIGDSDPLVVRKVRAMLAADAGGTSLFDDGIGTIIDELMRDDTSLPEHPFGPYRAVRVLGSGGMGVVYLGYRSDIEAEAAIKRPPSTWGDPARRELFLAETKTLAALSHPSIARLLTADHLPDGTPWFAMEYVKGVRITDWVWGRRLGLQAILRLFEQLCEAVQYAHEHAVIHRDLKPSNVLVTDDGTVKLLDFGIAKRFEDDATADVRTRTKTLQLSLPYAAPEQLRGKVVSASADVYALGVMLHELVSGRRPYDLDEDVPATWEPAIQAAHPTNVRRAARANAAAPLPGSSGHAGAVPPVPVPEGSIRPGEWRDLDALLSKALAPDAADRYRNAEALRRDVARFLARQPLGARKAGWTYRAGKLVERRWRELAAGTALVVVAAAGIISYNRSLAAARDAAIAEVAHTNRMRQFVEDMFQGGQQSSSPADSIRVETLVANAIRETRALTHDPAMQVDLLGTLGIMTERLGALDRADSLYRVGTERAEALYGAHHPETLRLRIRRARLVATRGKPDSAITQLEALEKDVQRDVIPDHPVGAELAVALGSVLRENGHYPEAATRLERAVAQRARLDSTSREYADALRELGNVYGVAGPLERADSLFKRALPIVRERFGPRHPDVAFLLANLGNTASQRGRLVEAEAYQREAAAITAEWYGPGHYLTAAVNGVLAQTLNRLKRYDEAADLMRVSIAAFERSADLGPNAAVTYIAHGTLAVALSGKGEYAAASREYSTALEGLRKTRGENNTNTLTVAGNLATSILHEGRADSSVKLLRGILTRATAALGETHVVVANTRVKLGESLLAAGHPAEAIPLETTGLHVIDSVMSRRAPLALVGRQTLLAAYLAVGDSGNAAKLRQEMADTARPPGKK